MQDSLDGLIQTLEAQIQRLTLKTSIFQVSVDMELGQCSEVVNPRELLVRYRRQLLLVQGLLTKYASMYSEYLEVHKKLKKELNLGSAIVEVIYNKVCLSD